MTSLPGESSASSPGTSSSPPSRSSPFREQVYTTSLNYLLISCSLLFLFAASFLCYPRLYDISQGTLSSIRIYCSTPILRDSHLGHSVFFKKNVKISHDALYKLLLYTVQKLSQRRDEPVRRLLCLTEATLVERDPATYNLITLRPLSMVAALLRPKEWRSISTSFYA